MDGAIKRTAGVVVAVVLASLSIPASSAADADYPVAGVTPHERPVQAPEIAKFKKETGWYDRALHGLEPPHPQSFRFLESQDNWHTPFNRPGMRGRYDIRGWHAQPGSR